MNEGTNRTDRTPLGRRAYRIAGALALALAVAAAPGCGDGAEKGDMKGSDSAPTGSSAAEAASNGGSGHHHSGLADELAAHTHSTRLEVSSEPAEIPASGPVSLTLRVLDAKSGQPVKEFDSVHEKLMHLIIVAKDLSWFNHIHPEYKGDGVFIVKTSLPRAGEYRLFADYTPKGAEQEVAPHDFMTAGAGKGAEIALKADTLGDGGWIIRSMTSAPEGQPEATGGAPYQVALMPMPGSIKAGEDVMLHFQVRDAAGKPVAGLEPYLGAMGHAVILSSDAKIYLHTHPMDGGDHAGHGGMNHAAAAPAATDRGAAGAGMAATAMGEEEDAKPAGKTAAKADVIFHTNFPIAGLYKVWGQFKHKGKIITAAYVLRAE